MKSKKIKIISLIALGLLIALLVPGIIVLSMGESSPVSITFNGKQTATMLLPPDGKKTLSCADELEGELTYQWQIMANVPGADFVDINGKTDKDCDVTYALIADVLDEEYSTQLRCRVSDGTEEYLTDAISVVLDYNNSVAEEISSEKKIATIPSKNSSEENGSGETNGEISRLYTITINFLYQNQQIAQKPATLSLAADKPVENLIQPIPPNVGYTPVLQDSYDGVEIVPLLGNDGAPTGNFGVELNFASLDSPKIINVVYMPALVDYVVHHHRQNLLDDNYEATPFRTVKMQGYTGSQVEDCHLDLEGFHALYYNRMEIAADGSTQVEIYYDRDYYLVSFDLAGGFGVDPIYTRYGSEIGVNKPSRPGYVFNGWSLYSVGGHSPSADEINKYLFTDQKPLITVESSLIYTANWERGSTHYTMAFWRENPNDDGYSYWGSLVVDSHADGSDLMVDDVVSAQDWVSRVPEISDEQYFTYNPGRSDRDVVVKGDGSSIVNVYYTRNRYTITFKANGTCIYQPKHTHGDSCYTDVCGKQHVHNEECIYRLTCTIPEHTAHNSDCLTCGKEEHIHGVHCQGLYDCGKEEHVHSPDCCTITPHTHSKDCYPNVGDEVSEPAGSSWPNYNKFPTNATNGYIARFKQGWGSTYYHYIYIDGRWYEYGKSANDGTIIKVNCNLEEHIHGNDTGCIHCELEEHVHNSSCVDCKIEEHKHGPACYKDVIHTHDESCYEYIGCDEHIHESSCLLLTCKMPTGHTHTSACNDSKQVSVVKMVTRKYQASLADIWPVVDDHGVKYTSGERWSPSDSSYYDQVLVYISDMPADDFTLTVNVSSYKTFYMHYMLEALPGQSYDKTYNGKNFVESFEVRANYNHITKAEDFFNIKGFTQYGSTPNFSGNQISQNGGDVYFYYKRNSGKDVRIEFNNVNTLIRSYYGDDLMYGLPLDGYQYNDDGTLYVPPYPDVYEKNAYKFDRWYTTPECIPGTEVDWDSITMPDGVLSVYAHWVPVKHTVRIFKDATLSEQLGDSIEVDHGTLLADPGHPTNGQYIFSGWFYKDDDGVEKAFVFNGIPVKDSIDIYAKWGSRVAVKYTVYYKIVNDDGTETEIALPTVGSTIAGQNRTFDAKGGIDLYEGYREGYFPLHASHSIIMSAENENEYTFYYVKKDGVPYTVKYVDEDGNDLFAPVYHADNTHSVVTETFVPKSGYLPTQYQIRFIISANEDENVITFKYIEDDVHAIYRVVHYWENLDGEYTVHSSVDITATVGTVCAAQPITITGYEFSSVELDGVETKLDYNNNLRVTLDSDGMLIAFYYKRQTVAYTVEYIKYGDPLHELAPRETYQGRYGATVTVPALDLTSKGYNRVSDALMTITLKTSGNVITFRYQENTANYRYVAIEGDRVNNNYYSEPVSAITGVAVGCLPVNTADYSFDGWFIDEACSVPVVPERDHVIIGADNKLVPEKTDSDGDGNYLYEGGVFYAKFNYNFSRLTITVDGCDDEEATFMFLVEGVSGGSENYSITVAIKGNGSVTVENIRVGNYKVSQIDDWSWRYEVTDGSVKELRVSGQSGGSVIFEQTRKNDKWLDGDGYSQIIIP